MTVPMIHDSIDAVLADRQNDHGEFGDTARTSQHIKQAMREGRNWDILSDNQKDALEMIAVKLGRILSGNANRADHWDDVTGYARLISRSLHQKQAKSAGSAKMPPVTPLGLDASTKSPPNPEK